MIRYTAEAIDQIDALRIHYIGKTRIEAALALDRALEQAERTITLQPEAGLPSPRPYPDLARTGRAWTKAGRYWISYSLTSPPVILAVFYEAADLPGRL